MTNNEVKNIQIKDLRETSKWIKQIAYWRSHLDVFIEDYLKIKLKDVQKVQARIFCKYDTILDVQSRGFGKTWLNAICCIAMCILYPGTIVIVASGTIEQANLTLAKIDSYFIKNEEIAREVEQDGHAPVTMSKAGSKCIFKNGSRIESKTITSARGQRAKILIIDEAPEVKQADLEAIIRPIRNYTRECCIQLGISDYNSKMISITSACLKSNYFYQKFVDTLKKMCKGSRSDFAYALDWHAAVRAGITKEEFFISEREDMPEEKFLMEYGSIFVGSESGSVFPYELTERCRVLEDVETAMPTKSSASYIMGIDLATSTAKGADNSVITILKLIECENGNYIKKLVYIRSFHGKGLDKIATEVRKLLVKFPNIMKIVFDHRGLGDSFHKFLSSPWIDPETKKEYPPLVVDTERTTIHNSVPLLHPFIATGTLNAQMVSSMIVSLEQESLLLPVNSRYIINNKVADKDSGTENKTKLTVEEKAIFIEADALQIEMGNVVQKTTGANNIVYDVAKATQHKDRYSSLGMAVKYATDLEDDRRKKINSLMGSSCIGIVVDL